MWASTAQVYVAWFMLVYAGKWTIIDNLFIGLCWFMLVYVGLCDFRIKTSIQFGDFPARHVADDQRVSLIILHTFYSYLP